MNEDALNPPWQAHTLGEALQRCTRLRSDALALITEQLTRNWQQISDRAHSYAKALMFLGGESDIPVGICGGRAGKA